MVKVLLGYGSECQSYDLKQRTPLHIACQTGNLELVHTLTLQGAKPDVTDILGRTPVHYAADANRANILEFFIERGINVTTPDSTGKTPLSLAQEEHSLQAMETLSRPRNLGQTRTSKLSTQNTTQMNDNSHKTKKDQRNKK
ncbi:hypothetical protein M9Y10_028214 [Tritrichomonas musculus]|uniref:Ankyrin repeat protein n=1 Tax=Tritrichomonas musculus TaxID=1915356 RepID=A0ABR2KIV1_9EUKA